MPFHAPGEDEFTESAFKPLAEDTYKVEVIKYEIKRGAEAVSRYNEDGNPRVRFFLEPIEIDGDSEAEIVDTADEPIPDDKYVLFFFDPDHLGLKPQVSKSRKFLAAALGVPVEQPVSADSLEEFCDTLVGRELIVDMAVKGNYNNITDSRPIRRKTRVRKQKETALVDAAKETFADEGTDQDDY
jgi:hypothetical protein